jgi:hypothetical protein
MRVITFLVTCIVVATLVGCETTSEPGDSPQPSFAVNSGVTESVTGSAHYTAARTGFTGWRTFSFNARRKADGSVEGRFQVNNHGGSWMKGSVSCFTIVDNQAWVGVVVEQGSRPSILGDRVFVVIDNGEGKNDPPDESTGMPGLGSPFVPYSTLEDFCAQAPIDGWSSRSLEIEAGNIQVRHGPTNMGGAMVLNPGEGKPDGFCFFGPWSATQMSAVRTPSGRATLSCNFSGLPPIPNTEKFKGLSCFLNHGGFSVTNETTWVRTPSGNGSLTCRFDE